LGFDFSDPVVLVALSLQEWRSLQAHLLSKHNWRCRLVDGGVAVLNGPNEHIPLAEALARLPRATSETNRTTARAGRESLTLPPGMQPAVSMQLHPIDC
jgi:hypothetical protein